MLASASGETTELRPATLDRVTATLGGKAAETLRDLLPPPGTDVATKDDIAELRTLIEALRAEMLAGFERIDQRFEQVEGEFARADERTDLKLAALRDHLTGAFHEGINAAIVSQTRTLVLSQLAALVAIAALAFGMQ